MRSIVSGLSAVVRGACGGRGALLMRAPFSVTVAAAAGIVTCYGLCPTGLQVRAPNASNLPLAQNARGFARKGAGQPASSIQICCAGCRTLLYKYRKNRSKGQLVKCFEHRIEQDFTAGDLCCPGCGQQFARHAVIRGFAAHKIVGGKVTWKH
jgi:hypothetical protein